jgi:hypothetical protein
MSKKMSPHVSLSNLMDFSFSRKFPFLRKFSRNFRKIFAKFCENCPIFGWFSHFHENWKMHFRFNPSPNPWCESKPFQKKMRQTRISITKTDTNRIFMSKINGRNHSTIFTGPLVGTPETKYKTKFSRKRDKSSRKRDKSSRKMC